MRERRANPRHSCRTRCQLLKGGQKLDATLLDVSRSGLSVHVAVELGQGEQVELRVASELRIRAIAWRTSRTRTGFVVGMMLSELTPGYEALLTGLARRAAPASTHAKPRPRTAEAQRKPAPDPVEPWWRLRVKECDGPRTRVVTLAAPTREAAMARTAREVGTGWEVLEARPAQPLERKPS